MDNFLNYLVKKSSIEKNEYFNYRQPKKQIEKDFSPEYNKILDTNLSNYVIFDLETTGLKAGVNKIIEIGAVKVLNNEIVDSVSKLINPEQFISPYIQNITNITNEMVENQETIDRYLPTFIEFISDLPLIAHNASFDMSFLIYECNKIGHKIENDVVDTLHLSRKYNKECKRHNLAYLTEFFNIELKNAHRAYFDALATNEVYKIIKTKTNIK